MAEDNREHREMSERYAEIAHDLIYSEPLLDVIRQSEATIIYLSSDKEKKSKGRTVFGECEKIPDKYKWSIPADFTITIYEPNIINFTDNQIRILLLHELLHVGIDWDKNGEEKYTVRPHDIEDFRTIIDRYGLDWELPRWEMIDDGTGEETEEE